MDSLELLLEKINPKGRYQIISTLLFLIIGMGTDFSAIMLSFMLSPPIIDYKDGSRNVSETLSYDLCQKIQNDNIKFSYNNSSKHNFYYDNGLFCNLERQFSMLFAYFIGLLVGIICINIVGGKRKENIFKVITGVFILSTYLIWIDSYSAIITLILISGFCHICLFIMRVSIISELTTNKTRELFVYFQLLSGIFIGCACPFIYNRFNETIDYRIAYSIMGGIIFIFWIISLIFVKVNPIFLLITGNFEDALDSAIYIGRINGVIDDKKEHLIVTTTFTQMEHQKEGEIISESELRNWMKNKYESKFSKDCEYSESQEIEVLIKEKCLNDVDNDVIVQEKPQKECSNMNIILFTLISILFRFLVYINVFEVISFTNENEFSYWFLFSMFIAIIFYAVWHRLITSKIGSKGCIILGIIICLGLRVLSISMQFTPVYVYLLERSLTNSIQIPFSVLSSNLFKNFSNQKSHTISTLITQVLLCLVPLIIFYLNQNGIHIVYIVLSSITFILSILIKDETNQTD